jgi:hypothetical protein
VRADAAEQALRDGASDAEAGELAGGEIEDRYRRALITAMVTQAAGRARP